MIINIIISSERRSEPVLSTGLSTAVYGLLSLCPLHSRKSLCAVCALFGKQQHSLLLGAWCLA